MGTEGMAAGWHQAGMAPASPTASFTTWALFGLERCAMPVRSTMFPHMATMQEVMLAEPAHSHPFCLTASLLCSNTRSIQSSAPQRLDFPAVEVLKDWDYTKRKKKEALQQWLHLAKALLHLQREQSILPCAIASALGCATVQGCSIPR